MGKRGRGSPRKVEKPGGNEKRKSKSAEKITENNSLKYNRDETGSDIKLKLSKVVIDYNCRLLAEKALCKTSCENGKTSKKTASVTDSVSITKQSVKEVEKIPVEISSSFDPKHEGTTSNSSSRQKSLRRNQEHSISQQKSQISKPEQVVTPTSKRRRKALTRALRRLRKAPLLQKARRTRASLRLSSPIKRSLRLRNSPPSSPEKDNTSKPRKQEPKRISPRMERIMQETEERESSSVASNNISPSPESDKQIDDQIYVEGDESDSEDDIEMQVLEKQVESEKEEEGDDDELPDVSLNLPDDTDEESSLLSPSALPASQLFRSPSSRRKKRKSYSEDTVSEKPKKREISKPVGTSTPVNPTYIPRTSIIASASSTYSFHETSPISAHPKVDIRTPGSLGPLPGKRGRGRPRKALEDVKSVSGKLYRKKLAERLVTNPKIRETGVKNVHQYNLHHSQQGAYPLTSPSMPYEEFHTATHQINEFYADDMGHNEIEDPEDPENIRQRLQRWKDRSTFVYARHKFVSNENKFRCDVCQVSFTALSSLKRHYGTIYHKQQEVAGGSTLDLSDILRPERDESTSDLSPGTLNFFPGGRGRGRGRPPLARTTSFVRRSAVDNIKKYYAAADAARRRRENYSSTTTTSSRTTGGGFTSAWLQKQQRKRKPLLHSDYLYTSASADSEVDDIDDDDDFGCEGDENNENDSPENGGVDNDPVANIGDGDETIVQIPWLSNVWKGIGPPHFTCEVCGESYTKKFEFTKHLFQHRQEEAQQLALTCPDCHVVFHNEHMLEQHFNLFNHGIGVIREGRVSRDVKKLKCNKCNSKFTRRDYYRKHIEVHKRPFLRCPHCPKKFNYKFYLSDHIKAKHDGWANNLTNNISSNGTGSASLPTGSNITGSNSNSTNPNNTQTSVPKPKVELYSSTTPLLISTETNKRKNSTISSSENFPYDDAVDHDVTIPKKKNSASTSVQKSSTSSISTERDIPVPTFITYDLFREDHDIAVGGKSDIHEENSSKAGCEPIPVEVVQSTDSTSSVDHDHPKKEMVNLLQKFFDSQKEQQHNPQQKRDSTKHTRDDLENQSRANVSSTPGRLSDISHSTTEDGKIVFQLEHSMFKGLTMKCGEGDENACNMSPLTIEIPRDNINIDTEVDGGNEIEESEEGSNDISKMDETAIDITVQDGCSPSHKICTPVIAPVIEENDKSMLQHSTNSNSSSLTTSSSTQLQGCGVKVGSGQIQIQPENELQCQDCGKIFEHKKSLIKHVRYYSQGESYPCTLCDKSFKLKHHVSRHIKSFHNVDTSSTTSSASEDNHLEDHGEIECLITPLSTVARGNATFSGSSNLLAIPSSSSSVVTAATTEVSPSPTKRSLSTDKSVLNNPLKERSRSASDASKKKEEAESAASSFSKSNYTTVVDSSGATVFKCLICKKLYPSKHQISSHLSYHKRTIPYKCTLCSAEFKFKLDLNTHQQAHNSERVKFICEKCPPSTKFFLSRKELLKHMREKHHHLGRKPLPDDSPNAENELAISRCPFCPLVFPQASDMQVHISIEHHKKGAFVCRKCGQILANLELLKDHMIQDHQMDDDEYDELGMINREEMEEDDHQTHTLSPHASPLQVMPEPLKADDHVQYAPLEADTERSSPECELLELN